MTRTKESRSEFRATHSECRIRSEAQANLWMAQQASNAKPMLAWQQPSRCVRPARRVNLFARVLSVIF